eukprot:504490_1
MPSCCKVCKSPRWGNKEVDLDIQETSPLILEPNNPFDELPQIPDDLNEEDMLEHLDMNHIDKAAEAKKTLLGMVIVAIGTALFCSVGAIVQYHGGSVLQLMLGRYITQNIIAWFIWLCWKPSSCDHWYGDSPFKLNIWSRGFLLFCTVFCWWRGLELVPLGDGEAILFLSPLVTVIAARLLLGEKLPSTFFLSLVVTLTGLVFICQPTFIFGGSAPMMALSWQGILFLIGTVFAWTGACVLVRTAKKAHWLQLEIVATTQSIMVWCPLVIALNQFWIHSDGLSGGDWDFSFRTVIVMVVIGILGFLALMLNVIGYQIGDATKVAWMEYLDLVFAFLYQWLFFGDIPTNWEIIGCCCLLSTCGIHLGEEYYHYIKAKNEKKMDEEFLAKAKEGRYNENNPMDVEPDVNVRCRLLIWMNRMNILKRSDYIQINE